MTDTQDLIRKKLDELTLVHGVGQAPTACTIAAINLALNGVQGDDRPDCVDPAVHSWVIRAQDRVSLDVLNGAEWRGLVPMIAGTVDMPGRLAIVTDAMWEALSWVQPGDSWRDAWNEMLAKRTNLACRAAARSASDAYAAAAAASDASDAASDASDAYADAYAAAAAAAASDAAAYAADAFSRFDDWAVATLRKLVTP